MNDGQILGPRVRHAGVTHRIMKEKTMSDPFIGDLTKAFGNVTVSRKRALQFIAGAMAVAVPARIPQAAEAGKHRKPPLAFVGATVTGVTAPDAFGLNWLLSESLIHPDSGFTKNTRHQLGHPQT